MPQTRAQQRAREQQGQAVTPPQRLPDTGTNRRGRRARAQPSSLHVVDSNSEDPIFSSTPEVPQVPKVRQASSVQTISLFGRDFKVKNGGGFTFSSAPPPIAPAATPPAALAPDSTPTIHASGVAPASDTHAPFPQGNHPTAVSDADPAILHQTEAAGAVLASNTHAPFPQGNHPTAASDADPAILQHIEAAGAVPAPRRPRLRKRKAEVQIALASPPVGARKQASAISYAAPPDGSNFLHLVASNGRSVTSCIPQKELDNLLDYVVTKYGTVDDAPKLTIGTGKRAAAEEPDDTRPARRICLDGALTGKGDATRSQKYRMVVPAPDKSEGYPVVIPTYNAQGHNTATNVFVPVHELEDDSDLDSELDAASSSFKENVPEEPTTGDTGRSENGETAQPMAEASGVGTRGSERHDQAAQDNTGNAEALQVPQTPSSRGILGNIVNSAVRFIPRFRRVPATPLDAPATPPQPTSQVQRPLPRTEPRPTTQPQTPSRGLSKTLTRAASVQKPHTKGKARTTEASGRLNAKKRAEKLAKKMELNEIEIQRRVLEQRQRDLQREQEELSKAEEIYKAQQAAKPPPTTDQGPSQPTPAWRGAWRKHAGIGAVAAANPESEAEQTAKGTWPVGKRIKEARRAKKLQRRQNSPERIPGPSNGGFGMNDEYFTVDSDEDDDTTGHLGNKPLPRFTPNDPSFPVGDPTMARPALGSYFQQAPTEPELHGGNLFRDVDAEEETASRAAEVKEAAAKLPPRTPTGDVITNLDGYFTVPYDSSSDEDEESAIVVTTPAPEKPAEKIFSGPAFPSIARQDLESPTPAAPAPAPAEVAEQATHPIDAAPASTPTGALKGILKHTPQKTPSWQLDRNRKFQWMPREDAIAKVRAHYTRYAPEKPSKLSFAEQAASSPAPPSESTTEPAIPADTRAPSPPPVTSAAAETSLAAQDAVAVANVASDNASTSSEEAEEANTWLGDHQMSPKVIDFINANFSDLDVDLAAQEVAEDFAEFMKTWKSPDPEFSPRVQAWLDSPEVQACIDRDSDIIAAEIGRSMERGFAL